MARGALKFVLLARCVAASVTGSVSETAGASGVLQMNLTTSRHCEDVGKVYETPIGLCFSPLTLFPGDPQWGATDILDTVNATHLHRSFFASEVGTCQNYTDHFTVPLRACLGPFGSPRPWGTFDVAPSGATLALV
uniref:Phospholipase B-like n=1 Tax=Noctiluca scintillans TaxID=2966 RepID=A0A7S1B1D8_NOCSC|mmetsp:Transcript_800/g.2298  ORF Transcript_800/g.2298 Transcript_800/m.2298 type:complete len:136 (+) Transcript_800:67-474(+)|eukprot:CAMPEP_0194506458 /NCGR_PEP_ID=MMETSP0253-20130528/34997_1 /TAXON_ID=2966 /ORGANISM="Noctiluca scintillans" /LENGTH=135 /DNA_ID=CAMNT_0039349209 /DNA_START=38 /DNA_END=445 /DNA_ORIENTATION=+